ncbi:hypothetical protein [Actinomadura rugatobispora]|uniref:SWIM-type domain-containing protein n=1 Tax=Actinomadura rugatobispora TaxID=1994 RepID=A0ABW1AE78_9ACTN|nr:hypothetical protein GCM10010200_037310 [Actinomadura rugatobispora]
MNSGEAGWEERSAVRVVPPVQPRKLVKVPFVELAEGRLQGVVSSGSDIARVYVSSIAAETHHFNCSTNNNRPCGGAGGNYRCKHLKALIDEAVKQYGLERVARYLKVEASDGDDLNYLLQGTQEKAPAAMVFSRFLRHLAYLEVPASPEPLTEMHWFPALGAVR